MVPQDITEGNTIEDAIDMAEDALNLHLWDAEESHDKISKLSKPGLSQCLMKRLYL